MSLNKLKYEIMIMNTNPPVGITAAPIDNNIKLWQATIKGTNGTPYENGLFKLMIDISEDYPFASPKFKFITKIYHSNINLNGDICLDILKDQWSPAITISSALQSIRALLISPNPDDPLCPDIARQYKTDRNKHDIIAKQWTYEYANYDPNLK